MDSQSQSISQSNNIKRCANLFLPLLSFVLPSPLGSDAQVMIQQTNALNLKSVRSKIFSLTILLLHATGRGVRRIFSRVQVFIQTRKVSGRLIAGIFLAGCLAPLCDIFYAFDFLKQFEVWRVETDIQGWYYENYSYLFLCLGPFMAWIFAGIGMSMFIPETFKSRHLLSIIIFYPVIKIMWLLQVTSDAEFHSIPHWAYWIYGAAVALCLWFISEYLVYLFNHRILNALSTLENITNNRKALPAEQVNEMYATTCTKLKNLI